MVAEVARVDPGVSRLDAEMARVDPGVSQPNRGREHGRDFGV